MAAVKTSGERTLNRVAIAAVLIITLIFLAPIYWIVSTSFKPRNLSTTIPPTVVFTPEISPFVKLFTKRSQLREPPTFEEYQAAPWWERMVFDGGEKVVRDGRGNVQWSACSGNCSTTHPSASSIMRSASVISNGSQMPTWRSMPSPSRISGCGRPS